MIIAAEPRVVPRHGRLDERRRRQTAPTLAVASAAVSAMAPLG
jgi:hypothetical protein